MTRILPPHLLSLELKQPLWSRFFSIAPVVLVGTRNEDGSQDLFTTHCVLPLANPNRFAVLVPPSTPTARNAAREGAFAVSFPRPGQVVEASLAANVGPHPLGDQIPTFQAPAIDAPFLEGAYVHLECEVERTLEELAPDVLVLGKVVGAYVDREFRRMAERDDHDLLVKNPLLAFAIPGRIAKVSDTDAFPSAE